MPGLQQQKTERIWSSQGRESRVESGTVDGWRISGGGDGDDEGPAIVQQDVEKRRGKGGGGLGLQRRMDGCRDFLTTCSALLDSLTGVFFFL